jgi:EAL domain-containing protein (putative c-di-GMP-specific phosphodiesterase class I)
VTSIDLPTTLLGAVAPGIPGAMDRGAPRRPPVIPGAGEWLLSFARRHAIPIAFVALTACWALVTHFLYPALLPEDAEGFVEIFLVSMVAVSAIVLEERARRALLRQHAVLAVSEDHRRALAAAVQDSEAGLAEIARERTDIAGSLAGLTADGTPEETATAICNELTRLRGVDFAALNAFEGPGDVVTVASVGSRMPAGVPLPAARAADLRTRAAAGAWTETWRLEAGEGAFGAAVEAAGVKAVAISPIGNAHGQVGMLLVGATTTDHAEHIVERLPALVEFATTAQALLGSALLARREESALRARIRRVLDTHAFHPEYQPIVDLTTGQPIGFEALTRFDEGTAPDQMFAAARRTGLGLELEAATLDAAVRSTARLPVGAWLSLNASPAFLLSGDLAMILARRTRPVVIEITEHDLIDDYRAVREAIASLGPDVRVAVDDAGAGIANFSHIVELRPDYVKLDAKLIHGLNADLARQALVVGLRHFARAMGHYVIAEGIETEEELAALRALDVRFGQGYLLGRPAVAPSRATADPVRV